jgi:DNA-binding response OmpR family regulator
MNRRILVIDDDAIIRRIITRQLTRQGYDVEVAPDGESGLEAVDSGQIFDAVICDLFLPGIDGIEVVRRLRTGHPAEELPILMLTGDGAETTRHEALSCGASLFLTKPFSSHEILSALHALFDSRRGQTASAA